MASSNAVRMWILFLVVYPVLFKGSHGRILHGPPVMKKNINSRLILLELGYDPAKLNSINVGTTGGVGSDRVSPGGPDPQHNSHDPPTAP